MTTDLAHKHNCHRNATCSNTHGSFRCTCVSVYTGDGVNCTGILVKLMNCFRLRDGIDNSFFPLFLTSDINECDTDTHNCHLDGKCINTDGSFRCACKVGYSGNGVLCSGND